MAATKLTISVRTASDLNLPPIVVIPGLNMLVCQGTPLPFECLSNILQLRSNVHLLSMSISITLRQALTKQRMLPLPLKRVQLHRYHPRLWLVLHPLAPQACCRHFLVQRFRHRLLLLHLICSQLSLLHLRGAFQGDNAEYLLTGMKARTAPCMTLSSRAVMYLRTMAHALASSDISKPSVALVHYVNLRLPQPLLPE